MIKYPSADQAIEPEPIAGQDLVDLVYDPCGENRYLITRDVDGLYRVYEEHWNTSWWPNDGECFWCRQGPTHLTDSKNRALELIEPSLAEKE